VPTCLGATWAECAQRRGIPPTVLVAQNRSSVRPFPALGDHADRLCPQPIVPLSAQTPPSGDGGQQEAGRKGAGRTEIPMKAKVHLTIPLLLLAACLHAQDAPRDLARAVLKELIEIDTTDSAGDNTAAANAVARRLRAAGFSADDVEVVVPVPKKGNLVARPGYAAPGGRGRSCFWRTWT